MNRKNLKLLFVVPIATLIAGCPVKDYIEDFKTNNLGKESIKNKIEVKETLEVSISCNKDTIQGYLDEGWTIKDSTSSEVACSWKTQKATKNCNEKLDKACKITVPDIIGEEIRYTLERIKTDDSE
ncbi:MULTISPECIES: hypothetical protein [Prochlorococcus]|uniref:hypothetical protein n=1 Tax=Prochlorococcus TaxID=1218 RepID=UPI0005338DDC|nr:MULTISPECIES: hypothetical protein [Prochlorococcus]KGG12507.1 putative Alpha-2-macroglobulin family N-termin [Prochlorococcus sp. MIT 0601]